MKIDKLSQDLSDAIIYEDADQLRGSWVETEKLLQQNLDLSLKFFFLNKDLQLGLNAYDVFRGQRVRVEGITNDVNVSFRNYYDTQSFRISLMYKFGNKKILVARKKFENQDEKDRTKEKKLFKILFASLVWNEFRTKNKELRINKYKF